MPQLDAATNARAIALYISHCLLERWPQYDVLLHQLVDLRRELKAAKKHQGTFPAFDPNRS